MFLKRADSEITAIKEKPVNLFEELLATQGTNYAKIATMEENSIQKQNYETYRRIADKKKNVLAFTTRAISAFESWGQNKNGDAFERTELVEHHPTFIMKPHIMNHNMEIDSVRGIIASASWIPLTGEKKGDFVETLIFVDRDQFPKYASRIENGMINSFSMGVEVKQAICSHCGNVATSPQNLCFLPNTQVIMADGTSKSIEDIKVGDTVLSHTGRIRKVTEVFQRSIMEEVLGFDVENISNIIWMTKEHPLYQVKWDGDTFIPAKDIKVGDVVVLPFSNVERKDTVSAEFAELFGWYLAEGWTPYKGKSGNNNKFNHIEFSVNQKEEHFTKRILELGEKVFGIKGKVYDTKNTLSRSIRFYKKNVGQEFYRLGGGGSLTKQLAQEVMQWSQNLQRIMLNAYFLGDGTVNKQRGEFTFYTSSKFLAYQVSTILRDLGIKIRMYYNLNNAGPTNRDNPVRNNIYMLTCAADQAQILSGAVSPADIGNEDRVTFAWDRKWFYPVRKITRMMYCGPVYNIEVEEEHSYQVEGIAVHNCEHASRYKNLVIAGKKVFEFNRGLGFIEQSAVVCAADSDSHTLQILASVQASKHPDISRLKKLAEVLDSFSNDEKIHRYGDYQMIEISANLLADRIAKDLNINFNNHRS